VNIAEKQSDTPTEADQPGTRGLETQTPAAAPRSPFVVRAYRVLRGDLLGTRPRLLLTQLLISLIPRMTFGWLRPALYRSAGLRIGSRTRIYGRIDIEGVGLVTAKVSIGSQCLLTTPLYLNASDEIRIGDCVTVGHHVVIITDNHRMDDPIRRGGERYSSPVVLEDGVWVGACVTILPGVTLGRGCVVAAGALVVSDVPSHTLVAGVPARPIKDLPR
jgi:acetyltransferase-like isoleucine patch superfamily enzyme